MYVCYCARTYVDMLADSGKLIKKGEKGAVILDPLRNEKIGEKCCGLCCRAVCITRNFFRTQNPRLINESGSKSRLGYNDMGMLD